MTAGRYGNEEKYVTLDFFVPCILFCFASMNIIKFECLCQTFSVMTPTFFILWTIYVHNNQPVKLLSFIIFWKNTGFPRVVIIGQCDICLCVGYRHFHMGHYGLLQPMIYANPIHTIDGSVSPPKEPG